MIKTIATVLLLSLLVGCADDRYINGTKYPAYGIANEDVRKCENVKYELSFGSVAVAFIFMETFIAPVYVIGWDVYEAVSVKDGTTGCVIKN